MRNVFEAKLEFSKQDTESPDILAALKAMAFAYDIGQRATPTSAIGLARKALSNLKNGEI